MKEVYAGAVWEKCVGGCGVELKAGGWQVCKACYRNGVHGRAYDCEPGLSLCRGCGVHVKASVGICRPCKMKENTLPEHVQSRTVPKRENRWARSARCVQQLVSQFQLEPGGRRSSGAWVYYPDGYEADVGSFGGRGVAGAFLMDSFFSFMLMQGLGIIIWAECCCIYGSRPDAFIWLFVRAALLCLARAVGV